MLNTYSYINIECSTHGVFSQLICSHAKGSGCPECAQHSQKYGYIYDVGGQCLKFGITNNPDVRLMRLNWLNKIEITRLALWLFPTVQSCKAAERVIMSKVSPFMSKHDMPEGHTETCDFSHISFIVSTYNDYGGVKQ